MALCHSKSRFTYVPVSRLGRYLRILRDLQNHLARFMDVFLSQKAKDLPRALGIRGRTKNRRLRSLISVSFPFSHQTSVYPALPLGSLGALWFYFPGDNSSWGWRAGVTKEGEVDAGVQARASPLIAFLPSFHTPSSWSILLGFLSCY